MAAFADIEERERDQVHPGEHAIARVAQEQNESGESQGRRDDIDADKELAAQEIIRAPFADVAHVDVLEEGVGDEVVAHLPEKVGQKDEQGECNAGPEPSSKENRRARVSNMPPRMPAM